MRRVAAALACAACVAATPADAAGQAELLGPARGDASCHPDPRSRLCLGAHDLAADGELVAAAAETRRDVSRVLIHDRRSRTSRTVATFRRGRVPVIDSVALGGGLVAWAAHDFDSTGPIRLHARRLGAGGLPTSRSRVFSTTPGAYDERDLAEAVSPEVTLAARGDGRVLAGWRSARSARLDDRAGVVVLLDRLGAPTGPQRTVTDRLAEHFTLTAVPGGFVAAWLRPRNGEPEIRVRRLDPRGVPLGPAETVGTGDHVSVAARGFDALVAWSRARGDELELVTRRLGATANRKVASLPGPAPLVEVALGSAPDGRWLLAAAVHPDQDTPGAQTPEIEHGLTRIYALDLVPAGTTATRPPVELRPRGMSGVTTMAWLPGPTLAWTSETATLRELPRIAFAPFG